MKIKIIFLFLFFANQTLTIDQKALAKWVTILATPKILSYITGKLIDKNDHMNTILLALSCGNLLSSVEQGLSFDPKIDKWLIKTVLNSIGLVIADYVSENYRTLPLDGTKDSDKSNTKLKKINFDEILLSDHLKNSFMGQLTKYLLIFGIINSIFTKILELRK